MTSSGFGGKWRKSPKLRLNRLTYSLFGQVVIGVKTVQTIQDEGNANPSDNGVPPVVVNRILNITIKESGA